MCSYAGIGPSGKVKLTPKVRGEATKEVRRPATSSLGHLDMDY